MSDDYLQIGWLTEAIEDDGDFEDFMAVFRPGSFGPTVDPLEDYDGTEEIHHSHGPVTKPIPVFIARVWPA